MPAAMRHRSTQVLSLVKPWLQHRAVEGKGLRDATEIRTDTESTRDLARSQPGTACPSSRRQMDGQGGDIPDLTISVWIPSDADSAIEHIQQRSFERSRRVQI
ncbi:hypothetical protein ASG87_05595 [Frateuria sp. Soil773]|nr:hypothetical protein ASG87_05595 [Frateuria sp. Soil773]